MVGEREQGDCVAFEVPPPVLTRDDGGVLLAKLLRELFVTGAGNGRYGGRLTLLFPTKGAVPIPPWNREEVQEVCRTALEEWPGLLDTLVWEDHPDLVSEYSEDDRLRLYGRLAFVALAESESVLKDGERDVVANRQLLDDWRTRSRRNMA